MRSFLALSHASTSFLHFSMYRKEFKVLVQITINSKHRVKKEVKIMKFVKPQELDEAEKTLRNSFKPIGNPFEAEIKLCDGENSPTFTTKNAQVLGIEEKNEEGESVTKETLFARGEVATSSGKKGELLTFIENGTFCGNGYTGPLRKAPVQYKQGVLERVLRDEVHDTSIHACLAMYSGKEKCRADFLKRY